MVLIGAVGQFVQYVSGWFDTDLNKPSEIIYSWQPLAPPFLQPHSNFSRKRCVPSPLCTGKQERKASKRNRHGVSHAPQLPYQLQSPSAWHLAGDLGAELEQSGWHLQRLKAIENGKKLEPIPAIKSWRDVFLRTLEVMPSQPITRARLPQPMVARAASPDGAAALSCAHAPCVAPRASHLPRATRSIGKLVFSLFRDRGTEAPPIVPQVASTQLALPATTPIIPSAATTPTLPANADTANTDLPVLELEQQRWIAQINLSAFDLGRFLLSVQGTVDGDASALDQLQALHAYLMPHHAIPGMALDLQQMEASHIAHFMQQMLSAVGQSAALDRELQQALFTRYFLSLAAPQGAAPILAYVSELTYRHPDPVCPRGELAAPYLKSIDQVRQVLQENLSLQNATGDASQAQQWVFDGLCANYVPLLARSDVARYGDLDAVLTEMGMALIGSDHVTYSSQQLIELAIVAYEALADPRAQDTLLRLMLPPVVHMAHAHGLLNAQQAFDQESLETAFSFFRSQLLQAQDSADPFGQFQTMLVTRSAVAWQMLERSSFNPNAGVKFFRRADFGQGPMGGPNVAPACLPENTQHALYYVLMADCMEPLKTRVLRRLPPDQKIILERKFSEISYEKLNHEFEEKFNDSVPQAINAIMLPALHKMIAALPLSQQRHWLCGEWTIKQPIAFIKTRVARNRFGGRIGVGDRLGNENTRIIQYQASSGLVLALRFDGREYYYWMTLKPFKVALFDGDVARLLRGKLQQFFKPLKPEQALLELVNNMQITYNLHGYDSEQSAAQASIQYLLQPSLSALRQQAFEKTDPEIAHEQMRAMLLGMIPFYDCVKGLLDGDEDKAALWCTVDGVSFLPVGKAAAVMATTVGKMAARMSKKQLVSALKGLFRSSIAHQGASKSITRVLMLERPIVGLLKQSVRFLDPGFELTLNALKISGHAGWSVVEKISKRLHKTPGLQQLADKFDASVFDRSFFKRDGDVWQAQPWAITTAHRQRYLRHRGKQILLTNLEQRFDVLAIRNERGLYRFNPVSDMPYGARIDAMRRMPFEWLNDCRHNVGATGCPLKITANALFGSDYYSPDQSGWPSQQAWQLFQWANGVHPTRVETQGMRVVDLRHSGYRAYAVENGARVPSRFYALNDQVWLRDHNDALIAAHSMPSLPEQLSAVIVCPDTSTAFLKVEFKVLELSPTMSHWNEQILAFSSYQNADAQDMLMVHIAGHYYAARLPQRLPEDATRLVLQRADAGQLALYDKYHHFNLIDASAASSAPMKFVDDCALPVRQRVSEVVTGVRNVLARALQALDRQSRVLTLFVPPWSGSEEVARLTQSMRTMLQTMVQDALLLEQSQGQLIGLGQLRLSDQRTALIRNAWLKPAVNPLFLKQALFVLDAEHFWRQDILTLTADLLQQLTRVSVATRNQMRLGGAAVYPLLLDNGAVDLQPLLTELLQSDSYPAAHTASVQQMVLLLSHSENPATADLIKGVLDGDVSVYRIDTNRSILPVVPKSPGVLHLCFPLRAKRSGRRNSICQMLPNAEFGRDYYSLQNIGRSVARADERIYQYVADASAQGGRLIVIEPSVVYRAFSLSEDGQIGSSSYFALDAAFGWQRDANGQLHSWFHALPPQQQLDGCILRASVASGCAGYSAASATAPAYVKVKFPILDRLLDGSDGAHWNECVLPYSSFQNPLDDAMMGMVRLRKTYYCFEMTSAVPADDTAIVLRQATPEQMEIFEQYRNVNELSREPESHLWTSAADSSGALRQFVPRLVDRTRQVMADALLTLDDPHGLADGILARFVSDGLDQRAEIASLKQGMQTHLINLFNRCDYLSRHQLQLIGFGNLKQYARHVGLPGRILALSIRGSMKFKLNPAFLNMPPIVLDLDFVKKYQSIAVDEVLSNLIHELSHTVLESVDTVAVLRRDSAGAVVVRDEELYAQTERRARWDLTPLFRAGQRTDTLLTNAAFIQHCVMLLAYSRDPTFEAAIRKLIAGRRNYYETRLPSCISPPCSLVR